MNKTEKIKQLIISSDTSIIDVLKYMDLLDKKLLIVIDDDKLIGIVSLGDVQRAIIANKSLDASVKSIMRKKSIIANRLQRIEQIKELMIKNRIEYMPIVDSDEKLYDVVFWDELFKEQEKPKRIDCPVIIMAGGKGTRMQPLTNIIPKPLIPIGDKSILENIFDYFKTYGCDKFHLSVNYKADIIKYYLSTKDQYNVSYFKENKPMGTAGSLQLLAGKINSTFIVSNCDILIEQDLGEIYDYHIKNKNDITVVSVLKNISIPYGTLETGSEGLLKCLTEKPDITYKVNTGVYILEPHLLKKIPKDKFYHITELIEDVRKGNGRVGVFPITEKSWKDIGDWKEYLKFLPLC